jgi:hypothetical protein
LIIRTQLLRPFQLLVLGIALLTLKSQPLDPYPYLMRAPAPIESNSANSRRRRCGLSQRPGQAGMCSPWAQGRCLAERPCKRRWSACPARLVFDKMRACVRMGHPGTATVCTDQLPSCLHSCGRDATAGAYHADMSDCTRFVPTDQLPSCLVISLHVLLMTLPS